MARKRRNFVTVDVEVDRDDILEQLDDEDLIQEVRERIMLNQIERIELLKIYLMGLKNSTQEDVMKFELFEENYTKFRLQDFEKFLNSL